MTHRLLIVDDHAGFRDLAGPLLQGVGFELVGAVATGGEALTLLADCRPDVLLLDVQLPDTTGFEVCRAVLRIQPDVRVVLCSIHPASDFGPEVTSCGAKGFLAKSQLSGAALLAFLK